MILADKISMLRKKNQWSQEELAAQLDISRQSVSKWESGASIPDLDKIIKLSKLFGVSTDYLLKDEIETDESVSVEIIEETVGRSVSLNEANDFLALAREQAQKLANAVMIFILSPIVMIILTGMAENEMIPITEDMAGGIGASLLLLLCAVGAGICVIVGLAGARYEYLDKEVIAAGFGAPEYIESICVGVLLIFVAVGVRQIIWSSVILDSFKKLMQEDDYSKEEKTFWGKKVLEVFTGAYWCVIAAVYLAISLMKGCWDISWIVWPVAGVLFAAVYGILKFALQSKNKDRQA